MTDQLWNGNGCLKCLVQVVSHEMGFLFFFIIRFVSLMGQAGGLDSNEQRRVAIVFTGYVPRIARAGDDFLSGLLVSFDRQHCLFINP